MKKHLLIIILIFIQIGQILMAQEIDSTLLLKIEEKFSEDESVNIEFGFFICAGPLAQKENEIVINTVFKYLNSNPNISIELRCYTDCQGRDDYNYKLSQRRAENISEIFEEYGISKDRISPIGMGEKNPIIKCENCKCPDSEHRKNRRLEIVKIK